jgi:polysaccharide pyruvyl transferase WcaK-like protein
LIGDIAYDERARKDLTTILEETGWTYEETRLVNKPIRSVQELLSQLAATDVVIASRFHNVLLSLVLNKPVVAISFHEKVDSLMSALGLEAYCQDIENIDLERLTRQLAALETNADRLKLQINQKAEIYRRALDRQYEIILKMLGVPELVVN